MSTDSPGGIYASTDYGTLTIGKGPEIPFQYNPATLRRTIQPDYAGGTGQTRSTPLMFGGAPRETIDVELQIDAGSSSGVKPDPFPQVTEKGIRPLLAALEMAMYPPWTTVSDYQGRLQGGALEVGVYEVPLVIFRWGARKAPVRISRYTVTETLFDAQLNPVQARVSISMDVIGFSEVLPSDPAWNIYEAYQKSKESDAGTLGGAS